MDVFLNCLDCDWEGTEETFYENPNCPNCGGGNIDETKADEIE